MEDPELGKEYSIPQGPKKWYPYIDGYPVFSSFLVNDLDKTGTIFRRFDRIAARNLLYLESELTALENRLDSLEQRENSDAAVQSWARNWPALKESADMSVPAAKEVKDVVMEIR